MSTSSPLRTSKSEGTSYCNKDIRNNFLKYQLDVAVEERDHVKRIANLSANMLNEVIAHVMRDDNVDELTRLKRGK